MLEQKGGLLAKIFPFRQAAIGEDEQRKFEEYRSQLEQRASVVAQGLARLGIRVVQLGTEELVELFFKIFNPGEAAAPQI